MAWHILRLVIGGAILLSVIYLLVSVYSRSVRREKLEQEWEEAGRPGRREDYVGAGLDDYDRSFRRKLIRLVFIVPVVLVLVLIYVMNFM